MLTTWLLLSFGAVVLFGLFEGVSNVVVVRARHSVVVRIYSFIIRQSILICIQSVIGWSFWET